MLIISLFLSMVLSLTRQSYNNLKSVQITTRILNTPRQIIIQFSVVLSAIPLLNPVIIPYSSLASTLLVTCLHFIELQCTIFLQMSKFFLIQPVSITSIIMNSSQKVRSVLFAKDLSVKIQSFVCSRSSKTNIIPLLKFSIYYLIRTLSTSIFFFSGSLI